MAALAAASGKSVHKLDTGTLEKLVSQARLQCETREDRKANPDAKPRYEVLPHKGPNGEPRGLAVLPPANPADVFFDMEGYPFVPGGLEYLFGTWSQKRDEAIPSNSATGGLTIATKKRSRLRDSSTGFTRAGRKIQRCTSIITPPTK